MSSISADPVLAKLNLASRYLAEAKTLQEVKGVIALAEAARVFGKHVGASIEAINSASEIRLRAERKLGEILAVTPKAPAGRPPIIGSKVEPIPTLASAGISKKTSSRAQALAAVPLEKFEAAIAVAPDKELNHNRVVKDLTEDRQREARQKKRTEAAGEILSTDDRIIVGDFRALAHRIADGSLSLIFTDPPYDREASKMLPALAEFAARKLADGGSLICYVGQTQLPAAMDAFRLRLRYWWTIACVHAGRSTVMREYGINAGWKAVLWFVKGTRDNNSIMVNDVMSGGEEKSHHDWQQSESEAAYWIEKLCPPGGLVCDPFIGGGTTAAAAKAVGRKWIGFEIDPQTAAIASGRIK
jgi:16S rRNA G966 N2-methylase RsmD